MKRIIIITIALGMALAASAQSDSTCADTTNRHAMRIDFGLSASATMYGNGNDLSPYYSKYGFGLHLPLMAHYDLSPLDARRRSTVRLHLVAALLPRGAHRR